MGARVGLGYDPVLLGPLIQQIGERPKAHSGPPDRCVEGGGLPQLAQSASQCNEQARRESCAEVDLLRDIGVFMNDLVSLPKGLLSRIEKLSRMRKISPESLVREAIADRVAYLEWEEKALAQGQQDLDAGRLMTTDQLRQALSEQRARRGRKATKAR
jgi:predicted transcriptional regulator